MDTACLVLWGKIGGTESYNCGERQCGVAECVVGMAKIPELLGFIAIAKYNVAQWCFWLLH